MPSSDRPSPDFEQFHRYGALPDPANELNAREVYDLTSKAVRDPVWRDAAADEVATLVHSKTEALGIAQQPLDDINKSRARDLKKNGYVKLPDILDAQQISDIHAYLEGEPIVDFYDPSKVFDIKNVPERTRIGRYGTEFNLNCPHLFEALNHPDVLQVIGGFLGATPTLSVLMLMWSFARGAEAEYMQLYHRDSDDYRFCKLFIYLTDVHDKEYGPHLFIKRSMDTADVAQRLSRLDAGEDEKKQLLETVFAGHPRHRYSDEVIDRIFSEDDKQVFCGPRGTTFIENTWGIHRGVPPLKGHRLLLQAQYSLQPVPMFSYQPTRLKSPESIIETRTNRYVNRLYVKP